MTQQQDDVVHVCPADARCWRQPWARPQWIARSGHNSIAMSQQKLRRTGGSLPSAPDVQWSTACTNIWLYSELCGGAKTNPALGMYMYQFKRLKMSLLFKKLPCALFKSCHGTLWLSYLSHITFFVILCLMYISLFVFYLSIFWYHLW